MKYSKKDRPDMSEYRSWEKMKHRCYNSNDVRYDRYGGRGIQVCEKWRSSYKAFIDDMGLKPNPSYTLDRINNDGDYEPGNCRWATRRQQNANRSNSNKVPGVMYRKDKDLWIAMLKIGKRVVYHKYFKTEAEAIVARYEAELKHL